MTKEKTFYRRKLPHWQPANAAFFITFRLHGSIPKVKLEELQQQHHQQLMEAKAAKASPQILQRLQSEYFQSLDELLDKIETGPHFLKMDGVANIIKTQLHRFDGLWYTLHSYCIMSNHVHILIDNLIQEERISKGDIKNSIPLDKILKQIKGASGHLSNQYLQRKGKFWQRESFDRLIRNERHFGIVVNYILNNPVKAGLVKNWEEWPHTYLRDR